MTRQAIGGRGRLSRLAAVLGAVLVGVTAACDSTPIGADASIPPRSATASPVPAVAPGGPVKGLADNPAFQWWRWPGGAQPDSWWGADQTPATLNTQTELMHELGVKLFRVELPWPFIAPTMPGGTTYDSNLARNPRWPGYSWDRWDLLVDTATEAGLEVVPEVYYIPSWANGVPITVTGGPNVPPASAEFYGDFIHAAVTRYRHRIHYWELGNEPDFGERSWKGSLGQYVDLMLRPGYAAVKEVDPKAKVLLGGLALDTHMQSMYAAGAAPYFDILSFHAYYTAAAGDSTALDHIQAAMRLNGDSQKPIWLTEFGVPTRQPATATQPGSASATGEAAQAQLIHDVYSGLKVQAIFFYELRDTAVYDGKGPIKYVYWGLTNRDFSRAKPGLDAYKQLPSPELPASG